MAWLHIESTKIELWDPPESLTLNLSDPRLEQMILEVPSNLGIYDSMNTFVGQPRPRNLAAELVIINSHIYYKCCLTLLHCLESSLQISPQ